MFKKGFTLIEIVIVIGILGVLSTISMVTFISFKNTQGINKDSEAIVEMLQQARTQTLSSQNASVYGVHFGTTSVTLFAGSTYSAGVATNEVYNFLSADTVLSVTLTGGGNDVIFSRLTGETTQNGTIVISSTSATITRTVSVFKTGVIEFK
jgi:prepilin-type N-terminal cleavage/methylation domain-containing protein